MRYLFELSKEHKKIPKSEIISIFNSENIDYELIEENENILLIDTKINLNKTKEISKRLSFTYYVNSFLFSCDIQKESIQKNALANPINIPGSIAVRYLNRSDTVSSKEVVKILASVYTKDRIVDLNNPDIEIRAIITDKKIYVGIKIQKINRRNFEERKVQNRPFFLPISLHPKLARAFVNISGVRKNKVLLDPFCGTGGFLIEAGLLDAKVIGSDIEEKMILGSKKNLEFYNIKNFELFISDIGDIKDYIKKVDCIVTDLPYGKSTTTKGEKITDLYSRTFQSISDILKNNGKAIIGLSNKDAIEIAKKYLSLIDRFDIRSHRSLVRYFALFKNDNL